MPLYMSDTQSKLRLLSHHYSTSKTALHYTTPHEILVATILSAQCTDERVNKVTPALFARFLTVADYANADLEELEQYIRSTGFYHNKAKNIKAACSMIIEKFNGEVPRTMEEMLQLPGVARKTANVVLHNAYGVVEGIVVDTHVMRLSQRLGFTTHTHPVKIEKDLMKIVPRKDWGNIAYWLIDHGRKICKARKPKCDECFLNKLCPSAFSVVPISAKVYKNS